MNEEDEIEGVAPEEEAVQPAPPPEEDAEAKRKADIEAKAWRLGWRPKSEYRGVPGEWRSAEEFLKRGDEILPIVRKNLEKERLRADNMEGEIQALRATVDEQKQVMEDLLKMARTASDAGYKRAIEELKAQQRAAAANGDIAAVVAISDKIEEVREERASNPAPKAPPAPPKENPVPKPKAGIDPVVQQFVQDNPWFNNDPLLNRAMEAEHMALLQEAPGLSLEENLQQAKEAVMARFPNKFGINPKPRAPAPADDNEETPAAPPPPRRTNGVAPPSPPASTRRQAATGIASITDPQERAVAQQAFARAKRQMPGLTEDQWFAIYSDPRADVIDVVTPKKGRA